MSSSENIADRAPVIPAHAPGVRLAPLTDEGTNQGLIIRRAASIIGSEDGCKVRLRHKDVSGRHCVLVNTGGDVFIRDLNSRKGTFLNDLRAEHEQLEDGDVIRIRPWEFRVSVIAPESSDTSDITGLGLEPAPAAVALEEAATGQITKLTREISLIGRRSGCDLAIEDRSVSRAHAIIFTYLSNAVVFDLGSHNGTWLNKARVSFAKLKADDVLQFGAAECRVLIIQPSPTIERGGRNGQVVRTPAPDGSFSDRIDIRASEVDRR